MSLNPRRPCGNFACHAAVVIAAETCSSIRDVQRVLGVSNYLVGTACGLRGIPEPKHINAPKRASAIMVRKAWEGMDASGPAQAEKLGMSIGALRRRAQALGLPPRPSGIRFTSRIEWPEDFNEMWRAGVRADEIAKACVPSTVWPDTVCRQARKRGLRTRKGGSQKKHGISLLQYLLKKDAIRVHAAAKAIWYGEAA